MLMAYLTLISGLLISAVAIFYSVAGLTAIFSAAPLAIIIMGVSLEIAKLVATVWIKQNWIIAPRLLKGYLLIAITILMVITSLGIFGFLSKAHSDQSLVSGDVQSKIAVYDEKIKTAKDNIDANRKALKQMDEAVDQVMGRSSDEKGAEKAVAIRRSQQKERTRLQSEIASEQKIISAVSQERAPIAAEVRKVEAEVGPIKYIAAFVYGDNTDANILEKAVTWVIILIVIVFDPLAIMLLLASQYSFAQLRIKEDTEEDVEEWFRKGKERARELDEEESSRSADHPVDSDPPIPAFLLKKNQPDFDAINLELAEAAVIPETVEPEVEVPPVVENTEFIIEVPYVHETGTDNPIDFPKAEVEILPMAEDTAITITHTADSMIIEDSAGTQEIPTHNIAELKKLIDQYGYTIENGVGKIHGIEVPENIMAELLDTSYVQNEEQKESSQWSKILNKAITEEEYLKAVQQKKDA